MIAIELWFNWRSWYWGREHNVLEVRRNIFSFGPIKVVWNI